MTQSIPPHNGRCTSLMSVHFRCWLNYTPGIAAVVTRGEGLLLGWLLRSKANQWTFHIARQAKTDVSLSLGDPCPQTDMSKRAWFSLRKWSANLTYWVVNILSSQSPIHTNISTRPHYVLRIPGCRILRIRGGYNARSDNVQPQYFVTGTLVDKQEGI